MKNLERQAYIIVDLGLGDSGKGTIVDFLSENRPVHTVIRYNGGAQAAHNVVRPDGKHHTFAQFGSGTFSEGVRTHLSRFMLVNPLDMIHEERHLRSLGVDDAFERMSIDQESLVTTPFHQSVNRLKEIHRNQNRHGSCGKGIGETMADYINFNKNVLFVGDFLKPNLLKKKLLFLRDVQLEKIKEIRLDLPKSETILAELDEIDNSENIDFLCQFYKHFTTKAKIVGCEYFDWILKQPGSIIFEGAQGVLLDQVYGFYPHTTWTDTTRQNAQKLLQEHDYQGDKTTIGVMRAYATRHGAGPFVTEDKKLTNLIPDIHNKTNNWQGNFRAGFFDYIMTQYALEVERGVDGLAVTHLDKLTEFSDNKISSKYTINSKNDNLSTFFDLSGDTIKRIKVLRPPTITHQAELTKLLGNCQPNYSAISNDPEVFLSQLEEKLKTAVLIRSYGARTDQKTFDRVLERFM